MKKVERNKSRGSKVLSIFVKSISTAVPVESDTKNNSGIVQGKSENKTNKYFPDELIYFAYRF